jgi:hypothetical protein
VGDDAIRHQLVEFQAQLAEQSRVKGELLRQRPTATPP